MVRSTSAGLSQGAGSVHSYGKVVTAAGKESPCDYSYQHAHCRARCMVLLYAD